VGSVEPVAGGCLAYFLEEGCDGGSTVYREDRPSGAVDGLLDEADVG